MTPATRERIREAARKAANNAGHATEGQLAPIAFIGPGAVKHMQQRLTQDDTAPDAA